MNFDSLIGLTLSEAQDALQPGTPEAAPEIVETAPPTRRDGLEPEWGELRVLRCREIKENDTTQVEMTVAREMLREAPRGQAPRRERTPRKSPPSTPNHP